MAGASCGQRRVRLNSIFSVVGNAAAAWQCGHQIPKTASMWCHVQVHAKDEGGNSTSEELLWLEDTMHEEAEHKAAYAGTPLSLM